MKKFLILLLVVVLAFSACSKDEEQAAIRVGVCVPSVQVDYLQPLKQELQNAGCQVRILDGKYSQAFQNRQVAWLVREHYDLIVIQPVIRAAEQALLKGLDAAHIPAVVLGSAPEDAPSTGQVCHVGYREEQAGALQGLCVLRTPDRGDLNGDGIVRCAILAGPEDRLDTAVHTDSCLTALDHAGIEVQVLECLFGEHDPGRGQAQAAGLLSRYGDEIEVLFCGSEQVALGALEALRAAGKAVNRDLYVVAMGGGKSLLGCVERGELTGTVLADHQDLAVQVTRAAKALLAGQSPSDRNASYVLKEAG